MDRNPDTAVVDTTSQISSTQLDTVRWRSRLIALVRFILYFIPSLLWALTGRRLIQITNPDRIGHLVGEMDAVLKEERLGLQPPHEAVLLAPRGKVANERIVDHWAKYVSVVRSPAICRLLRPMCRFPYVRFREDMAVYVAAVNHTARYVEIQRLWGDRPPLLALTEEEIKRGRDALEKMGVPPNAPFVCFHSREGGYSPKDEHWHNFRNSSVLNYLEAVRSLAGKDIYCIRMGDPSMQELPETFGVVDYAHSAARSDWMDVFLCAECLFFLGNSSGVFFLASAFGRPCALANLVPFSGALPFGSQDLGIPKLLWSERENRYLTFREILDSSVANFRFARLYQEHGVHPVENSAEEIRGLALEMLERVTGRIEYTPQDEVLQARFKALLKPGHHTYGSVGRIGRDFLRKYEYLIGDAQGGT